MVGFTVFVGVDASRDIGFNAERHDIFCLFRKVFLAYLLVNAVFTEFDVYGVCTRFYKFIHINVKKIEEAHRIYRVTESGESHVLDCLHHLVCANADIYAEFTLNITYGEVSVDRAEDIVYRIVDSDGEVVVDDGDIRELQFCKRADIFECKRVGDF